LEYLAILRWGRGESMLHNFNNIKLFLTSINHPKYYN
jgi:hypothetical protein